VAHLLPGTPRPIHRGVYTRAVLVEGVLYPHLPLLRRKNFARVGTPSPSLRFLPGAPSLSQKGRAAADSISFFS